MSNCRLCEHEVAPRATKCPNCGAHYPDASDHRKASVLKAIMFSVPVLGVAMNALAGRASHPVMIVLAAVMGGLGIYTLVKAMGSKGNRSGE